MKILIVLTSHQELGSTGQKTGYWLEELVSSYYIFSDAGLDITIVSPKGELPPIDPKSQLPNEQTASMIRFNCDPEVKQKLSNTRKLFFCVADHYDAAFYPGGHGSLWDLVADVHSIALIEYLFNNRKPVALVGHAVGALINVKDQNNQPLVKGKQITGFSNSEEAAIQLTQIVPFLLEDRLKQLGAIYSKAADDQSYSIQDGLLITGQNPASAGASAELLLKFIKSSEYANNYSISALHP